MGKNRVDIYKRVSPSMLAVLKKRQELTPIPVTTGFSLSEIRNNYEQEREFWNQGGPAMFQTKTTFLEIEGRRIKLRTYQPLDQENLASILYFHGGSFIVGSVASHDRIMRTLAAETKSIVIGIEYSLAPEAQFPVALIEGVTVYEYLQKQGLAFNLNPNQISLAGDSTGANLALGTALYLRDHRAELIQPKALLLYYGDFGLFDSVSMRLYGDKYDGLLYEELDPYREYYFPEEISEHFLAYYDLLEADLSQTLPPIFVASAEIDAVRDDSQALTELLLENQQKVELSCYPGVTHGFLHYGKLLPITKVALSDGAKFLTKYSD